MLVSISFSCSIGLLLCQLGCSFVSAFDNSVINTLINKCLSHENLRQINIFV